MAEHSIETLPPDPEAASAAIPHWTRDLKLLVLMAAPNVATMVAETMLSMVDFWIVSHLGPGAQAAVSSSTMVFMSVFGLLMGTMVCVSTVVGQSFGANRPRDCSAYLWQGMWICLLFGFIGVALWPVIPSLYALIGHAPDVQGMEVSYTRIRLLSLGAAGMTIALGHFFNGIQRPRTNMISVIGANVINGVVSYGLVFGVWGLPRLGFDGAAVGSVIATVIRVVWLMAAVCFGATAARYQSRHTWRPDFAKMVRLLKVGWPSGVHFVMDITAWAMFLTWIIGQFGTIHLAATATCWRLIELSFMPAVGIGLAICALVGESVGQGQPSIARRRAAMGAGINMAYMGSMAVIFIALGARFMDFFSDEPEVIALGAQVLILAAVFQLFDAVAISYSMALRGAGDTLWPATVGAILVWTVMIGGATWAATVHPEWGSAGPWVFAAVFVILIGFVLWFRWHNGRWENLDVIGRGEEQAATLPSLAIDPLLAQEALAGETSTIGSSPARP
ncbi:MAG: hypothetical protein AMXMBFR13_39940 [Phycisphaerae bacterium]